MRITLLIKTRITNSNAQEIIMRFSRSNGSRMVSYLAIMTTREVIKAKVLNFKIGGVQLGLIP